MEPDLILPNPLVLISNDATETGLYAAQDEAAQKVDGAAAMGDFGQPQVAKFDVWKISVFRGFHAACRRAQVRSKGRRLNGYKPFLRRPTVVYTTIAKSHVHNPMKNASFCCGCQGLA
jgi:hypothetical protein